MKIEWIGTGSGLNPKLGNTSFLVEGENRTLLVDCGFTVPLKLIEIGKLKEITDIILTHAHADHIGGIESLVFMNYFSYKKRKEDRPNLYIATDEFAHNLWEHSLKGGLEKMQIEDNESMNTSIETYFKIHVGKNIEIPEIPKIKMFPTLHVSGMENYGVRFDNGVFYSGDTIELPPHDPKIIFQDCQFFETRPNIHISYDRLKKELPAGVREKTFLVHLSQGWDKEDAIKDGFAGFVIPGKFLYFDFKNH